MLSEVLTAILSPELQEKLLPVKILFLAASVFFLAFMFFAFLKTRWFKFVFWYDFVEFFTQKIYGGVATSIKWMLIKNKLKNINEADARNIIIRCHNMLEKILERLVPSYQADKYSERLARIGKGTFTNIEGLWEAHEAYRSVTKDPHLQINSDEFKRIIDAYEQALVDLEIIK